MTDEPLVIEVYSITTQAQQILCLSKEEIHRRLYVLVCPVRRPHDLEHRPLSVLLHRLDYWYCVVWIGIADVAPIALTPFGVLLLVPRLKNVQTIIPKI